MKKHLAVGVKHIENVQMFDYYTKTKQISLNRRFNFSDQMSFTHSLDSTPEEFEDESKYKTSLMPDDMDYLKMIPIHS